MSRHISRLHRIEENLKINESTGYEIVLTRWDLPNDKKYFKDENEERIYREWRIAVIREEYKHRGIPVPMMAYCFDEEDVKQNIEGFHKYQKTPYELDDIVIIRAISFDSSFIKNKNSY